MITRGDGQQQNVEVILILQVLHCLVPTSELPYLGMNSDLGVKNTHILH